MVVYKENRKLSINLRFTGVPAGNRTRNLQRRRLSLYPIALQTHNCIKFSLATPIFYTAGCRFGCRFFLRCVFCGENLLKTAIYSGIFVKCLYRVLASEAFMVSNSTTGTDMQVLATRFSSL